MSQWNIITHLQYLAISCNTGYLAITAWSKNSWSLQHCKSGPYCSIVRYRETEIFHRGFSSASASSESSARAEVDQVPFLAARILEGSKAILKFLSACVRTGDCVSGNSDALNFPTPWWWLRQPPALSMAHRAACSKFSKAFRAVFGSKPVVQIAMYMYSTPPSSYSWVILHDMKGFPGRRSCLCLLCTASFTAGQTSRIVDLGKKQYEIETVQKCAVYISTYYSIHTYIYIIMLIYTCMIMYVHSTIVHVFRVCVCVCGVYCMFAHSYSRLWLRKGQIPFVLVRHATGLRFLSLKMRFIPAFRMLSLLNLLEISSWVSGTALRVSGCKKKHRSSPF